MGAMQFIPSTWKKWGTDADADGRADPYDLDDAALSAAYYLCANGRDLGTGEGWWQAVLSYNNLEQYADDVYQRANRYGVDSTTR
jgi:membrane-bound lytic murein transglycosylase B